MIGNLVHSSPNIKKEVLAAGALQPVIGLLTYASICFDISFTWFSSVLNCVTLGLLF